MPIEPPNIAGLAGLAATFDEVGPRLTSRIVALCDLHSDQRVLDVGCGIGRVALPLAAYLGPDGAYEGFDIVAEAVAWCRDNLTAAHPNFHFRHVPIHNERYNPTGTVPDADFVFPYDDASFDLVVLTSVFTHMMPAGVEQYMGEIARVLVPGGRLFATMFLLDEEAERLRRGPGSVFSFAHQRGVCSLQVEDPPETAVAYQDGYARGLFATHGFALQVFPGSWCGRTEHLDLQDILIGVRA